VVGGNKPGFPFPFILPFQSSPLASSTRICVPFLKVNPSGDFGE